MNGHCEEYDRFLDGRDREDVHAARWREHFRTCPSCRKQTHADAALREAFVVAPPALSPGFEARLQQQLDRDRSNAARALRRPGGSRLPWEWALVAYITAATFASVLILSSVPWP